MASPGSDFHEESTTVGAPTPVEDGVRPRRPRIGVLSNRNLASPWASTHYYAATAVGRAGANVRQVAEPLLKSAHGGGLLDGISRRMGAEKRRLDPGQYRLAVLRDFDTQRYDAVLALHSSSLADVMEQSPDPVIYVTDATADLLQGYYPDWKDLPEDRLRVFHEGEHRAINRADRICVPTQWAADSVIERYRADPDKVSVVEWGANLDSIPPAPAERTVGLDRTIRLLFIGLDWRRKGGDIAVAIVDELGSMGLDARLDVVGGDPPRGFERPNIRSIGRLNRAEPQQAAELDQLLRQATFVVHPARAECFGHVLCEALAFGTPVVATNTGGIPQCVTHSRSGVLLAPGSSPREFAEVIRSLVQNQARYTQMQQRGHEDFRARLNWDRWASRVLDLVAEVRPAV